MEGGVLRMHADRAQHERVVCRDLRAEAKLLLEAEHIKGSQLPRNPPLRLLLQPPQPSPVETQTLPMAGAHHRTAPRCARGRAGLRRRAVCGRMVIGLPHGRQNRPERPQLVATSK